MRSKEEITDAMEEMTNRVWYDRHMVLVQRQLEGKEQIFTPDQLRDANEAAEFFRERYGAETLGPHTDMEWGMLLGKLSALRWVLGEEWDSLDT